MVAAALVEHDMAVAFHEAWRPMAYDRDLHRRMGRSKASQTFLVIRAALRRETLLALLRLWDTNRNSLRMSKVAESLKSRALVDALGRDRAETACRHGGSPFLEGGISPLSCIEDAMREDIAEKAAQARMLIARYLEGGERSKTMVSLKRLRNERLAHRQLAEPAAADPLDEEVERLYADNTTLVGLLSSLVNGVAYDPEDTAKVHRVYAANFWINARSEESQGHPLFRPRGVAGPAGA